MAEIVRPLEPGDASAVSALEARARDALVEARGGTALLGEVAAVVDWSHVPTTWVATFDDVVVGYLQLVVGDDVAEVRQVYVQPEARELGFGDWLLEAAIAHGREAGCRRIEAVALPGDRDTKNLYERAGITARKIVVSRQL